MQADVRRGCSPTGLAISAISQSTEKGAGGTVHSVRLETTGFRAALGCCSPFQRQHSSCRESAPTAQPYSQHKSRTPMQHRVMHCGRLSAALEAQSPARATPQHTRAAVPQRSAGASTTYGTHVGTQSNPSVQLATGAVRRGARRILHCVLRRLRRRRRRLHGFRLGHNSYSLGLGLSVCARTHKRRHDLT